MALPTTTVKTDSDRAHRNAFVQLIEYVFHNPSDTDAAATLGRLLADYLGESSHQSWPGFDTARQYRVIQQLMADIHRCYSHGDFPYPITQEVN